MDHEKMKVLTAGACCGGAGGATGRWSPVAWKPFLPATYETFLTLPSGSTYLDGERVESINWKFKTPVFL